MRLGYIFLRRLEGTIKGTLVYILLLHRLGSQAIDVLQRSVRRIKITEYGASASFVTSHKVKARIFPKAALENFNEAIVVHARNEFCIKDRQKLSLKQVYTNL
jgi:hypothetical protein